MPYFIPANAISIIKGSYLLRELLEADRNLINRLSKPDNEKAWRKLHNLKLTYAKAKSRYCEHQRTELHIDW